MGARVVLYIPAEKKTWTRTLLRKVAVGRARAHAACRRRDVLDNAWICTQITQYCIVYTGAASEAGVHAHVPKV